MAQSAKPRTWSERLTKVSLAERYSGLLRNIEFGHERQRDLHHFFVSEVEFLLRNSALSPVFTRQDELEQVLDDLKTSALNQEKLFILHFRTHGFRVNTAGNRWTARAMLNVFSDDTRLVRVLKEEIKEYDRHQEEFRIRREKASQVEAAESELIKGLRKKS
ncbi:MAG: hypothetical protein AAB787_02645 [Patescibacteria group bacterium]